MTDLMNKISSYNIFNYLFPGVIFAHFYHTITQVKLGTGNIIEDVFIYYFIGLIISKIGSVFIEPFLLKLNFLSFTEYDRFIEASKNDIKIEILSEVNNTFRTLVTSFLLLSFIKIFDDLLLSNLLSQTLLEYIFIYFLLILFLFSYKKQTKFIFKRVERYFNEHS